MFTLSDASKDVKELLKWGGLILASLVLVLMAWKVFLFVKNSISPTPPPKPTVAFGKLPQQVFPQSIINTKINYSVNTLTGQLPELQNQVKIYRVEPIQPDLLALSKFNDQVNGVGFSPEYTAISDKVFEWKSNANLSNLDRRLRFNVVNYSFNIISPYTSDSDVLSAINLPNQDGAKNLAQTMFENMQVLSSDIDVSKTKTSLFSIQNGNLSPATSISNTQIIEVDFFQNDIDKIPIYYENPNSSNIRAFVGGGGFQGQIVAADYILQKISNQASTYPIKTSNQAFEDLKQGKGYIASYTGRSSSVSINNVFLAYYVGMQPQDFVMPIYVFVGSDNFYAYVPAVTDEWISM